MRSVVKGTGFVVGEHLVPNSRFEKVMETSDQWIRERSGIEQRYFAADGVATSDLGVRAAKIAMEQAGVAPQDIDYVVFATMTPDHFFPGSGCILQAKLGLRNIPALDIRQQCTGFIYALQVSDALLKGKVAKNLLLIGAESHSPFMPFRSWDLVLGQVEDKPVSEEERAFGTGIRDRAVLFGDAGAAVVLRREDDESERGLIDFELHSDGTHYNKLYVPSGMAHRPYVTEQMIQRLDHVPHMDGKFVFRMAVTKMPEVTRSLLARHGYSISDVKMFIFHQANLRINEAVQQALGIPPERIYNNIQRYGNTTAATIPIAYDECRRAGKIQPGDLCCFVGLGSGFHWGAALLRD
jgi:3-oxoacyl-[acyl-carrier-protein] synthase-3